MGVTIPLLGTILVKRDFKKSRKLAISRSKHQSSNMGSNCYLLMGLPNSVKPMVRIIRYSGEQGIKTQIKGGSKSPRISMALAKQRSQFQMKLLFILLILFFMFIYDYTKEKPIKLKRLESLNQP